MTLADFALAVTLGSFIGMTAILWDLWRENKRVNARADYLDREARRYIRKYNIQKLESMRLRTNAERAQAHYVDVISKLSAKLSRFDRPRGEKGKFVKKGGA